MELTNAVEQARSLLTGRKYDGNRGSPLPRTVEHRPHLGGRATPDGVVGAVPPFELLLHAGARSRVVVGDHEQRLLRGSEVTGLPTILRRGR